MEMQSGNSIPDLPAGLTISGVLLLSSDREHQFFEPKTK